MLISARVEKMVAFFSTLLALFSTLDELEPVFGVLARRYWNSIEGKNREMVIFDRGIVMFEAVAVAVIAMKNQDDDLVKAEADLDAIVDKHCLCLPREKLAVLIKHGETLEDSVRITMRRESDPGDKRYAAYQRLLQSELQRQELAGVYQHTILIAATDSIINVQNQLRQVIFDNATNTLFQPMMDNADYIYMHSGGFLSLGKAPWLKSFATSLGRSSHFEPRSSTSTVE